MLWIFAIAIIMPIDIGLCAVTGENVSETTVTNTVNLTAITWDHAVNRQKKLTDALESDVKMIEADVSIGKLIEGKEIKENAVIMAHGPDEESSDLSLSKFLTDVIAHNKEHTPKGIKLDFKSIEAFTGSIDILKSKDHEGNLALWLNADIVKSSVDMDASTKPVDTSNKPVDASNKPVERKPVDAEQFIAKAKEVGRKTTWSVGWTTKWTENGVTTGKYTEKDVEEMKNVLKEQPDQAITFPVRAGLVANSQAEMKKLLSHYKGSTLTIWSSPSDEVNAKDLQKFIKDIGVDKIYLDVPKMLANKLDLGSEDKSSKSSANKIAHIGLLSIVMLILAQLF